MRYIESQVYRAAVENVASEMAARMVAMKAASDNAGKLITELQLIYNKARRLRSRRSFRRIVGGALRLGNVPWLLRRGTDYPDHRRRHRRRVSARIHPRIYEALKSRTWT